MTTALEGGEGSASRPGRSLPPGKTLYPLYRRLGGTQGRSGRVRKISPTPGFDPRTIQPVASRYTDSATRPTQLKGLQDYFTKLSEIVTNGTFPNLLHDAGIFSIKEHITYVTHVFLNKKTHAQETTGRYYTRMATNIKHISLSA